MTTTTTQEEQSMQHTIRVQRWNPALVVIAAVLAAMFALGGSPAQAQTKILHLYDGPPQGTWRPMANAIAQAIQKEMKGTTVTIEPGGGLSNVIAVEAGKGEIGMVASSALYLGVDGKPPFKAPTNNVKVIATLYPQPAYIMTLRSDLHKITDLKGLRVSVTPKGYASEQVNRLILKTVGMSYDDIKPQYLSELDSVAALRDNHIDALMGMGSVPYAVAIDLASTGKLHFVPIDDKSVGALHGMNKGLLPYVVKGGTYQNVASDLDTAAVTVLLVANKNVPDDVAKAMTKAVVEALPDLKKNFNTFSTMTPASMAQDIGVPFHPGAAAYFKDAGIVK
jgi:TRAP transporter TAXI family solute receptor